MLVHGNPETAAIWRPLIAEFGRDDLTTISPPGFGAELPNGFGATADEYLAWLESELSAIGEPVDLIGHDWGSNHVLRLACQRPDLLRSWCGDTGGAWAPDYVWHDVSRLWRTPDAGEQAIAGWLDMGVTGRAALNESLGMTPDVAQELAEAFDGTMGQCVLRLYRSGDETAFARWRTLLPKASARPGLLLIPTADGYTGTTAQHRWTAERAGAEVAELERLGHWWMLENPARGADALRQFWDSL